MNTRIDHRLALCDQCKEFALSNQGFGHANVFDDLLGFFLTFSAGYVAKHGHGVSDLLHFHAAGADGTATVVFQLAVLFHSRKITVNARNGNACSCRDVTHRGRFTVASVVFVDVIQDDLLFRIGSSTHRFSLEQIVPFDIITQDFPLVNRFGTKCFIFLQNFFERPSCFDF